jgi:hypothetical protein
MSMIMMIMMITNVTQPLPWSPSLTWLSVHQDGLGEGVLGHQGMKGRKMKRQKTRK